MVDERLWIDKNGKGKEALPEGELLSKLRKNAYLVVKNEIIVNQCKLCVTFFVTFSDRRFLLLAM